MQCPYRLSLTGPLFLFNPLSTVGLGNSEGPQATSLGSTSAAQATAYNHKYSSQGPVKKDTPLNRNNQEIGY